jgi:hypothetical protein
MRFELLCWAVGALALALLAGVGYRAGRRRRPALLPPDLVAELSVHKLECLAEPPARVALELALLVGSERATSGAVRDAAHERCQARPAPTPPDRRAAPAAPLPAPAASGRGRDARRS